MNRMTFLWGKESTGIVIHLLNDKVLLFFRGERSVQKSFFFVPPVRRWKEVVKQMAIWVKYSQKWIKLYNIFLRPLPVIMTGYI